MIDALFLEYAISFPTVKFNPKSGKTERIRQEIKIPVRHTDRLNDAVSESLYRSRSVRIEQGGIPIIQFDALSLDSSDSINSKLPPFREELLKYERRDTNAEFPMVHWQLEEKNSGDYEWNRVA